MITDEDNMKNMGGGVKGGVGRGGVGLDVVVVGREKTLKLREKTLIILNR